MDELFLHNPLTEEEWDKILDVDFDKTDRVVFRTKHGKEVVFLKLGAVHGRWIMAEEMLTGHDMLFRANCSVCGYRTFKATRFCPNCGADMRRTKHE